LVGEQPGCALALEANVSKARSRLVAGFLIE